MWCGVLSQLTVAESEVQNNWKININEILRSAYLIIIVAFAEVDRK